MGGNDGIFSVSQKIRIVITPNPAMSEKFATILQLLKIRLVFLPQNIWSLLQLYYAGTNPHSESGPAHSSDMITRPKIAYTGVADELGIIHMVSVDVPLHAQPTASQNMYISTAPVRREPITKTRRELQYHAEARHIGTIRPRGQNF